jgi:hypothetical protein
VKNINVIVFIKCEIRWNFIQFLFYLRSSSQWARISSFTRFLNHYASQSVGLLWMSDQLVTETSP